MGFNTLAELETALDADRVLHARFRGIGPASAATPAWHSGWYTQNIPDIGGDPAAGSGTPGAGGTAYTNATGGILFGDTTDDKFIIEFVVNHATTSPLGIKLVDRLVGVGGIAVNSTGNKNVNSVPLPRYTSGEGIECYIEIQTAGITTAPVVSLASYTNQAGTGGRVGATTTTFNSATSTKGTLQGPLALQAGDTGIQSVELLNVATAGGGSGVVNLILVRNLMWSGYVPITTSNVGVQRLSPFPYTELVRIFNGATLAWFRKGASSASSVEGFVRVVMG